MNRCVDRGRSAATVPSGNSGFHLMGPWGVERKGTYLQSHFHKNIFLYLFVSNIFSIYFVHSGEPFSFSIFGSLKKFGIEDDYIWVIK